MSGRRIGCPLVPSLGIGGGFTRNGFVHTDPVRRAWRRGPLDRQPVHAQPTSPPARTPGVDTTLSVTTR
jgi:hypothetical protein